MGMRPSWAGRSTSLVMYVSLVWDRAKKYLDLMNYLSRKSPSRTYSIYRLVAMSLSNSDWGPWRNVQISRGKQYVRVWKLMTSNASIADGGKTSHPDPLGRR